NSPVPPASLLSVDCSAMSNLYEYAFSASPGSPVPPIVVISRDPVTHNIYLAYRHRFNDPKLKYSVLLSNDLSHWSSGTLSLNLVRRVPLSEAFEDVVFVVKNPTAAPRFFQVQVSCGQ